MAKTRAPRSSRPNERFRSIPPTRVPRSAFDLSHSHKTTFEDGGVLYPVFHAEVLPGDTWNVTPTFLARLLSPTLVPVMDTLYLDWQFFFCPARLLQDNFTKLMGERDNPDDHNDYLLPQMVNVTHATGTLGDHLGLPITLPCTHNSMLFRMYNFCYDEWYRDANLIDSIGFDTDDGPDNLADYVLKRRGKRKDYFSGALPFAQRGDPVSLPIGSSAPVVATGNPIEFSAASGPADNTLRTGSFNTLQMTSNWNSTPEDIYFGADTGLEADLSSAVAATINEIRVALGLQHLFERDARGGGRYREQLLVHFGVQSDDIRLMRPEVLATGSMPINVQPVPNTNADAADSLGFLGGYAVASQSGRGFMRSFTEHGYIMGIASVRAELTYQFGMERSWWRRTRVDHYFPDLALLGEQTVRSGEIFWFNEGTEAGEDGDWSTWGWVPRYDEYRHRNSYITGELRSTASPNLDEYHYGINFGLSRPLLNEAFINENPPVDRVVSDGDIPNFIVDCFFKARAVRPMPAFANPGLTRF